MRSLLSYPRVFVLVVLTAVPPAAAQEATVGESVASSGAELSLDSLEARNKALARAFYEDLWFSDRTDHYDSYLAEEYVVHDIGDRKEVVEQAVQQQEIADFFHARGDMTGSIDYQIAEGDLVATRWQWELRPTSWIFRLLGGRDRIPIINVFRFEDGEIVEIWNHRHDIDTVRGTLLVLKGVGIGLLAALAVWGVTYVVRGRRNAT